MVYLRIDIDIPRSKQREFIQTANALVAAISRESGCVDASITYAPNHTECLLLMTIWQTSGHLDAFRHSRYYAILYGGIQMLASDAWIEYSTGDDAVKREHIYQRPSKPKRPIPWNDASQTGDIEHLVPLAGPEPDASAFPGNAG
jgi:quinol monooxygenase YgiN